MKLLFLFEVTPDAFIVIFLVIIIIALFFIFVWGAIENAKQRQKLLAQAEKEYRESLAKLKANPTNADLKQKTLEFGRKYSNLTREKKGVTIYDEIALMNDINAACAGTTTQTVTLESRLEQLENLKLKALISEAEYDSRREQILSEI